MRACLTLVAAALCASASAQPYAAADALLADSLSEIGGRAVLVVAGPEGVRHTRAFGPIGPNATVPIASASKWLSGAVLLSVIDRGEMSLDTRVEALFPEAPAPVRTATVRQLFSHTSGVQLQPLCLQNRTTTLDACALDILARPTLSQPGAAFVYGGGSMQVAAAMAERATGQTWASLFEARIAGPLGMAQTMYGATDNPWVGGGADASAQDYAAFLQMVLLGGVAPAGTPAAGQRVLSEASVAAMLADQTGGAPVQFSPFTELLGVDPDLQAEPRYGVGVWREQTDASGALRIASSPGALGFWPWIDVPNQTVGVLLVLSRGPDVVWTALELERRVAAVSVAGEAPARARLGARIEVPRPNPVHRGAQIAFVLPESAQAQFTLVDTLGRTVAVLTDARLGAGRHAARIEARGLAAGAYVAVLRVDGEVAARRALVVR